MDYHADSTQEDSAQSKNITSSGLFQRVSSSVSGLFSNVPWLNKGAQRGRNRPLYIPPTSQASQACLNLPSTSRRDNNLKHLYPEEGLVTEEKGNEEQHPNPEVNTFSPSVEFSYFQKAKPIISSTPVVFSALNKKRKADKLLDDDPKPGPSTSHTEHYNLPTPEGTSLRLLKKSLYSHQDEGGVEHLNPSVSSLSDKRSLECDQHEFEEEPTGESSLLNSSIEAPIRKRPRFSVSTYGAPLGKADSGDPSFSIFYPGKVMYGGASNHYKRMSRIANKKPIPRAKVTVSQPSSSMDLEDGGLSSAAKRILSCIDKISTPLSNSKRMYLPKGRNSDPQSYIADFHKHRPSLKSERNTSSPPVSKLLAPVKVHRNEVISSLLENKGKSLQSEKSLSKDSSFSSNFNLSNKEKSTTKGPEDNNSIRLHLNSGETSSNYSEKKKTINHFSQVSSTLSSNLRSNVNSNIRLNNKEVTTILKESSQEKCKQKVDQDNVNTSLDTNSSSKNQEFSTQEFVFSQPIVLINNISSIPNHCEVENEFSFSNPIEVECDDTKKSKSFGDAFTLPKGSWECNICLLNNSETANTCVACQAAKCSTDISKQSSSTSEGLLSFLPPKDSWECEVCLLQNQETTTKCMACETPKASIDKPKEKESYQSLANWGDAFKPPEGSWDCEVCLLQNLPSSTVCLACQCAKPKPASNQNIVNNWGDQFLPPKDAWECEVCLLENIGTVTVCVACKTPKPGNSTFTKTTSIFNKPSEINSLNNNNNETKTTFKFGFVSSPETKLNDGWSCETCLVRNKETSSKCSSCETPRNKVISSTLVSEAMTGNFQFKTNTGAKLSTSSSLPAVNGSVSISGGFQFGLTSNKEDPPQTDIKKTAEPLSFSFGIKKPDDKTNTENPAINSVPEQIPPLTSVPEKIPTLPSFTMSPLPSSTPSNLALNQQTVILNHVDKKENVKPSSENTPPIFSFGSSDKETSSTLNNTKSIFNNVAPPTEFKPSLPTVENPLLAGTKSVLKEKDSTTKPTMEAKFSFSDALKTKTATGSLFSIENSKKETLSYDNKLPSYSDSISTFTNDKILFGGSKQINEPSNITNSKPQENATPKFSFGSGSNTFSFGNNPVKTDPLLNKAAPASQSLFQFGGSSVATDNNTSSSVKFPSSPPQAFNFGGGNANSSNFIFGSGSQQNGTTTGPVFQFGQQSNTNVSSKSSFDIQDSNPFSVLATPSTQSVPQKRIIKRAMRRNK